jgi:hypothetical protein
VRARHHAATSSSTPAATSTEPSARAAPPAALDRQRARTERAEADQGGPEQSTEHDDAGQDARQLRRRRHPAEAATRC